MRRLVTREELSLVWPLALLYFLIIVAFTLGKVARDGLFLSKLPAELLPYVYIALALLAAAFLAVLERAKNVGGTQRNLVVGLLAVALSLILFSFWFRMAGKQAAVPFYLWNGIYGLTLVSQFWILVTQQLDPRQAKRLFGLVGAAGICGGLVAGASVSIFAEMIVPRQLLVVAAGVFAAAALVATLSGKSKSNTRIASKNTHTPAGDTSEGFFRVRYVRLLILLFAVAGMVSGVLDYAFKLVLQQQYSENITSLLGAFYGAQNAVALFAQLGLAGFLFSRFGNRIGATTLAGGVLVGSMLTLSLPTTLAGAALLGTRFFDATMRNSLARSSWEFLYFPLSDGLRQRCKRLIDVVVTRGAEACAGLLILSINFLFGGSWRQICLLICVLAAVWLYLEIVVGRAYTTELSRFLGSLIGRRTQDRLSVAEAIDPAELTRHLFDPEPSKAIHAIDLLESIAPEVLRNNAQALLQHPVARVRSHAMAAFVAGGFEVEVPTGKTSSPMRTITDDPVVEFPSALLSVERVAEASRANLIESTELRRQRLIEWMDDADDNVRKIAFRCAGRSRDLRLLPEVIGRLEHARDRATIGDALSLWGESGVGTLGDFLADSGVPRSTKGKLVAVLQKTGGQYAISSLLRTLDKRADRISNRALAAVQLLCERAPEVVLPATLLDRRLRREVRCYCHLEANCNALEGTADERVEALLKRVFAERASESLERIFRLLALTHRSLRTMVAYGGLSQGNRRVRAQAIEYLDNTLPADLKKMMIPVLEASAGRERTRVACQLLGITPPSLEEVLFELLENTDSWLRACGLFGFGTLGHDAFRDRAEVFLEDSDPLVKDTARWAIERFLVSEVL